MFFFKKKILPGHFGHQDEHLTNELCQFFEIHTYDQFSVVLTSFPLGKDAVQHADESFRRS